MGELPVSNDDFGDWSPDPAELRVVTAYLLAPPEQGEWPWEDHCEGMASGVLNALHRLREATPPAPEVACEAKITVGHETFGCYAVRAHPGFPHAVLTFGPCSECGGRDAHATGCNQIVADEDAGDSGWWGWEDHDEWFERMTDVACIAWTKRFVLDVTTP